MDFNFSEEQRMLRDMVGAFLAARYDFDSRRAAIASPEGWRPDIWKASPRSSASLHLPSNKEIHFPGWGGHGRPQSA